MTGDFHNYEAEKAALASMILSGRAATELVGMLEPKDFYRPMHRLLFAAIVAVVKSGADVDLVSISAKLGADNLREIGGFDAIIDLADFLSSPSNSATYAGIVKALAWKREKFAALGDLMGQFEDTEAEVLAGELRKVSEDSHTGMACPLIAIRDVSIDDEDLRGLPTGYGPIIDDLTGVGYVAGQLNVISAYHKGGKTSFAAGSFAKLASMGKRVVYATFADLSPTQLKRKILKQLCGAGSFPKVRSELQAEFEAALAMIDDPNGKWRNAMFYAGNVHGRDVEVFVSKMLSEHYRLPIDGVFVDYIQRVGSNQIKPSQGMTAKIEHVSDQLAGLAAKAGFPAIVASQVTKTGHGKDEEWATKYAKAIEEDAGWVLRLVRENNAKVARIICPYNRFGRQNVETELGWSDERVAFVPMEVSYSRQVPQEQFDPFADD